MRFWRHSLYTKTSLKHSLIILLTVASSAAGAEKVVIAHRGASGYLPEHTLAAKVLAYGMGADFLEQDLVLTSDDVPVVLHDVYLEAVTDVQNKFPGRVREDGHFYVVDFSLVEVKSLLVSERVHRKTGEPIFENRFPGGHSSYQIPTFAEEIELIQSLNRSTGRAVGIYTEIKSPAWHRTQGKDISKAVLEILDRYGYNDATSNAFLQCFDRDELRRIRFVLHAEIKLVQLLGASEADSTTRTHLADIATYAQGIGPYIGLLVKPLNLAEKNSRETGPVITELTRDAHDIGLIVHPYTFRADYLPSYANGFESLLSLFFDRIGVDGIFTDHPDQVRSFLDDVDDLSSNRH